MRLPTWLSRFKVNFLSIVPFFIYRVVGQSMEPSLHENDIVVALKHSNNFLNRGSIIIFQKNNLKMIKRINKIQQNKIEVEGDNSVLSNDSRHFGPLQNNEIIGKVVWAFHPHR